MEVIIEFATFSENQSYVLLIELDREILEILFIIYK